MYIHEGLYKKKNIFTNQMFYKYVYWLVIIKKNIRQYIIQYNMFIIILLGCHGNVNWYKKLYVYYCS